MARNLSAVSQQVRQATSRAIEIVPQIRTHRALLGAPCQPDREFKPRTVGR
jgi:hypothetical protein